MKKHKFLLSILSLSLFIPSTTYADCTKEEIDNFKEIEDEYKVTYEFDKDTKTYTINFVNPNPGNYGYKLIYVKNEKTKLEYNLTTIIEKNYSKTNFSSGNYIFEIYGNTDTCNEKLKSKTLVLPKYNKYSEDPLCEGIEEFVLCQPTYDKDIDYESFVSRVNSYKNKMSNTKKEEEPTVVKEENKILKYVKDNLIQIIIIIVFIIMVIITIILTAKSIRKSRRLE